MKIVIFEDFEYKQYYPLSLNRPVFLLKCGFLSLLDKIKAIYPLHKCLYLIREELQNLYSQFDLFHFSNVKADEEYFFISGQVLTKEKWDIETNQVAVIDNKIVGFKLMGNRVDKLKIDFFFERGTLDRLFRDWELLFIELSGKRLNYLFDFVSENKNELNQDFIKVGKKIGKSQNLKEITVVGEKDLIVIHKTARVYPGVFLLCENGPIVIDAGAEVKPLSVIEGPCYIGKKTLVEGAKIRGSSIFNNCKVAGEIENTIMLDLTNKHHEGYLGHSYIGSFVNLGALSTTSDLKNNYSEIVISIDGEKVKTGSIKVGAFIGDHTKLGIGSLINTGTVIGMGCNLFFEGEMYPKEVPSFLWGGKIPFREYHFNQFVENCDKVLIRRNKFLKEEEITLFHKLFELEKEKRERFLISH